MKILILLISVYLSSTHAKRCLSVDDFTKVLRNWGARNPQRAIRVHNNVFGMIRSVAPTAQVRTVGLTQGTINGRNMDLLAVNGVDHVPGALRALPDDANRLFNYTDDMWVRRNDAEAKILESIARRLRGNPEAKGSIRLFSSRPLCDACRNVLSQFRQRFPNIEVETVVNNVSFNHLFKMPLHEGIEEHLRTCHSH